MNKTYQTFLCIPRALHDKAETNRIYTFCLLNYPDLACPGFNVEPNQPFPAYLDIARQCEQIIVVQLDNYLSIGCTKIAYQGFSYDCEVSVISPFNRSYKLHPLRPQQLKVVNSDNISLRYAKITKIH